MSCTPIYYYTNVASVDKENYFIAFFFLAPTCQLTFQTVAINLPITFLLLAPSTIAIADFNNDGHMDLAVSQYYAQHLIVLLGNGDGSFEAKTTPPTGFHSQPGVIVVDDFNSDGYLDLAFANDYTNQVGVLLGNGDGTFRAWEIVLNGSFDFSLALVASDFNSDGHPDLLTTDSSTNKMVVLLGVGDGTFRPQTSFYNSFCRYPTSFAAADFNSDNKIDLAITSSANYLCVLLGNGNASFYLSMAVPTDSFNFPWSVAVDDVNNDNRLDIIMANNLKDNIAVMLGNGDGTFGEQTIYLTGYYSSPRFLVVGDFNNDARLDIAVSNYYAQSVSILFGTKNGTFVAPTMFLIDVYTLPISIVAGDFNNDGKLDLAVADQANGNLFILLNTCDCCVPEF